MTLDELKTKMKAATSHLSDELGKVRTGRAHPGIVEDLSVEAYGSPTPLKGLASISTPEPRQILISPWDKGVVKDIEKAIQKSDLGLSPTVVGTDIRLVLPDLTEERREELVVMIQSKAEQARVTLRNLREDYLKAVKANVEQGGASEDDIAHAKKEAQVVIDESNTEIDRIVETKVEQIRTV
ncbi:MAG: ribosome recycling factor [bacterium]|nr:ribosome recycling factor [bacterium]